MSSRFSETLQGVPLCTLLVVAICVAVHIAVFVFEPPLTNWSIVARNVLYLGEWYRVITAAFLHMNLMHIG